MSRFWRLVKIFFITLISLIFLVIATCFVIVYFYEDKVIDYAIKELNKQLNTEIHVEKVELTILRTFPSASLVFTNASADDAIKSDIKGQLFKAKSVFLQFDFWDIFYANYKINKIKVKDGLINIRIFSDGTDNYHIVKETKESEKSALSFNLEKVYLQNVAINFIDKEDNQDYAFLANDMIFQGNFSEKNYQLKTSSDIYVDHLRVGGINYLSKEKVDFFVVLDIKNDSCYTINESNLEFSKQEFMITGYVNHAPKNKSLELAIKGKDLSIEKLINRLPIAYKKHMSDYKTKGNLYFEALIKGRYDSSFLPVFSCKFGINNGTFIQKENDIALENINLSGSFTNGNSRSFHSCVLELSSFSANLKGGSVKGSFRMVNFNKPTLKLVAQTDFKLQDIQNFVKIDTIESISGDMKMNLSYEGTPTNIKKFTVSDFMNSQISGRMNFANTNLKIKNNSKSFSNINASFQFNNNDIIVDNLTGKVSNTDIKLNGIFRNAISYIFLPNQKLYIDASLHSAYVNLNELLHDEKSGGKDNTYALVFTDALECDLKVDFGKLIFRKFEADNLRGNFRFKDKKLYANDVSFSTMTGTISLSGLIDASHSDEILATCEAKINKVDIKKMFNELENFGQDGLKDENIRGTINADVQFASILTPQLKFKPEKIYAKSNITIEKGELINYKPLNQLSAFIKVSELQHVTFSTLQNKIEIKDRTIFIPSMEIKSSALNITLSGKHTFDNSIDYHVKLILNDVLAQKARKAKKENEDFGVVEDDGLGKISFFISIFGTVDKPIYKYDSKSLKGKVLVDVVKERDNLKTILNEEFGWFKKDSMLIKQTKRNNEFEKIEKLKDKEKKKKKKKKDEDVQDGFKVEW